MRAIIGTTIAAEKGATEHELMTIFGWENLAEAERYTGKANRDRLIGAIYKISIESKNRT